MTVDAVAPALSCSTRVAGNDVVVSWNDIGAADHQLRRNDRWAASVAAGATSWTDPGAAGAGNGYQVRHRLDGVVTTVACA